MSLSVIGFRRPYSIGVSEDGCIVCLTMSLEKKIHVIFEGEAIYKSILDAGLQGAEFVSIYKRIVIILDSISREIVFFDLRMKKITSLKLPGTTYGAMKLNPSTGSLFISVIDLKRIITLDLNDNVISTFLDYSNVPGCGTVNGIALKENGILLIDMKESALFDISLSGNTIKFDRYLRYGRGGEGKVRNPSDVGVVNKYVVVCDKHNYLIQLFDVNLNYIFQMGGKGASKNKFDLPVSICVINDDLYICDQNNDRIIRFNTRTKSIEVVIEDKFNEGSLRRPSGITVGKNEKIYVADRSNGVIQVFDSKLNYTGVLNAANRCLNRPSSISYIEKNGDGYMAILERRSGSDSVLNMYKMSDDLHMTPYSNFNPKIALNDPQDMHASSFGYIYVADTLNRRILKTDLDGNLLCEIDMIKISNNLRILIKTIFIRTDGAVFTADFDRCIVYQFDENLNKTCKIDFSGKIKHIRVLRAIYATDEYLILCVRGDRQVLVANYQGVILRVVETNIKGRLDWNHPVKICAISDNGLLISDKENDRILKYDDSMGFVIGQNKSAIYG